MREQRKVVTVLFCDLVGSTALGESTDPEALRAPHAPLLRGSARRSSSATAARSRSSSAMRSWPSSASRSRTRTTRCAPCAPPRRCGRRSPEHGLEARIGVNTGEVVVGGEGETLVTGDAVNVAARLEQAARAGEILIGAETRAARARCGRGRAVEPLELKGKSRPSRPTGSSRSSATPRRSRVTSGRPLVGRERERRGSGATTRTRRRSDVPALHAPRPRGDGQVAPRRRLPRRVVTRPTSSADAASSYGEGITYWPLVEMLVPLGIDPETASSRRPGETRVAFRRLLEARATERRRSS